MEVEEKGVKYCYFFVELTDGGLTDDGLANCRADGWRIAA